jgi:PAS domain S-box-containing protein
MPWLLIALSSLLIVVRRSATLGQIMETGGQLTTAEVLTLIISLLFFSGVILMSRMFRDISKGETVLRETSRRLDEIIEHLPDATFVVDNDKKVVAWNMAMEQMTGIPKQEIIGKGNYEYAIPFYGERRPIMIDLLFLQDDEFEKKKYDEIKRIGNTLRGEVYVPKIYAGKGAYLSAVASKLQDASGNVIGAIESILDITDRKLAEESIIRAKEEWERTFEAIPDMITLIDQDHRILRANRAMATRLGCTPPQVEGCLCYEAVHGLSAPPDYCPHTKLLALGKEAQAEVVEDRLGGIFDVRTTPLLNGSGKLVGSVHLARDITEHRQFEVQLAKSNQILSGVLGHTHMMAVFLDPQFNFIWVNHAYAETCGHETSFFPDKNHFDLYPHAENQTIFQSVVDTGVPFFATAKPFEFPDQPERSVTYWDWSLIPVKDPDGQVTGLVFTLMEVTERIRAEKALIENEETLLSLFNAIHESVCLINSVGIVLAANETFAARLGRQVTDCIGQLIYTLVPDDVAAQRQKIIEQVILTAKPVVFEDERQGRWLSHSIMPILGPLNTVERLAIYAMDITERKKQEERRALLSRMLDDAPASITIHDVVGRFLYANRQTFSLHGYDENEFMAINLHDMDVPESEALLEERFRQIANNGEASFDVCHFRKDGTIFPLRVQAKQIQWEGRPVVLSVASDISERRMAEDALQRVRFSIENLFEGVFWVGETGCFMDVNAAACGKLGYTREELLTMSVADIDPCFPPEQWATHWEEMKQCGTKVFETVHRAKNGNLIPMELVVHNQSFGNQWYNCVLGRDITERKQADEALKDASVRVSMATKAGGVGVWEYDLVHNRLQWDEQMYALYGISRKAFGGAYESWRAGVHPEDIARGDQEVEMALCGDKELETEFRVVWPDGTVRHIQALAMVLRDADGKPLRMIGTNWDITERKRAEEALREQRDFSESLIETAQAIILVLDTQGRIVRFNPYMEALVGYELDEVKGMDWFETFLTPEIDRTIKPLFQKTVADVNTSGNVNPIIAKDGRMILVEWYNTTLKDKDGCTVGVLAIGQDITDRKRLETDRRQLEERLVRSEKMEALGTLAGGVAHDLNNVLGVVIAFSELLLDKIDETSPLRSYVKHIMDNSDRAAAIVDDLLTMTRRGVQTEKVFNLNATLIDYQKTPEYQRLLMLHPHVRVETRLDPELLNIQGSPVHLTKTIMNLVTNGLEAMPNGGCLTITTVNQYLDRPVPGYDEAKEGDYVVLSVSDTGEGIPVDDMKRIFEPFYTKKSMGKSGTGLGLSVVWGTVKDHNGYIDVQSEVDKGSTFILYFPVTREEIAKQAGAVPVSEYMGKGELILVVDDVFGQRELATQMLVKLNYNVESVSSGEDAVAYVKSRKPDLLVLDMIMDPGLDGLETYRRIIEIHPQQKAIIVSGFSETDKVKRVQELGAGAFVKKPYASERLGVAVRGILERK